MIIQELVSLLGFEVDERQAREAQKTMNDFTSKARNMALAVARAGAIAGGAAVAGLGGMTAAVRSVTGPLDEMVKTARAINFDFEAMQEWGFAASQAGSSAAEFQAAATSVGRGLAEAARGAGRARSALEAYGLSATDSEGRVKGVEPFLGELADRMGELDEGQALDLAAKLGIGPGMVALLRSGASEIDALRQTARDLNLVFREDQAIAAEGFNDTFDQMGQSVDALKNKLILEFLPVINDVVTGVRDWMKENSALIAQEIGPWLQAAAGGARSIVNGLSGLAEGVDALVRMAASIAGLDLGKWRGLAIAAGLIALAFAPWKVAIVAAALAIDDLLKFINGEESHIGAALDWLKGAWDDLAAVFNENIFEPVAGFIQGFIIDPINAVIAAIERMVGGVRGALEAIGGFIGIGGDNAPAGMQGKPNKRGGAAASQGGLSTADPVLPYSVGLGQGSVTDWIGGLYRDQTNNTNVGGVNVTVNVAGSNASPEQIGDATWRSTVRALGVTAPSPAQ